jgi:hypothetical protein
MYIARLRPIDCLATIRTPSSPVGPLCSYSNRFGKQKTLDLQGKNARTPRSHAGLLPTLFAPRTSLPQEGRLTAFPVRAMLSASGVALYLSSNAMRRAYALSRSLLHGGLLPRFWIMYRWQKSLCLLMLAT